MQLSNRFAAMTNSTQLQDADIEELQDSTVSASRDTAFSRVLDGPYSSTTTDDTSIYHHAHAPKLSGSKSTFSPIQTRYNSYGIQRVVHFSRDRFSGWQMGMILAIFADLAIFFLVLALTVYTALNFRRTGYQATLIDNNCDSVRSWSTWLHLGVNVVCTILLATSSYTMQCLTSPSRKEINKAHQRGNCMDIGVPSFQNLLRTSPRRMLSWLVILLSSLPLHLLANSAVYETQGANSYVLAVVEEDFLSRPLCPAKSENCADGLSQGYSYQGTGFNSGGNVIPRP